MSSHIKKDYKVRIEIGKGKNFVRSGSIPLPKKRVCNYIKEHPFVRKYNTKIRVTDLKNKKTITGTQSTFCNSFGKFQKRGI